MLMKAKVQVKNGFMTDRDPRGSLTAIDNSRSSMLMWSSTSSLP
jgi:hypothetical protein